MHGSQGGAGGRDEHFRTAFVVNPRAGGGTAARWWPEVEALLHRAMGRFAAFPTTRPGEAKTLARRAVEEGYEMVVAVGGDGTLNEVLNGFLGEDGRPVNPEAVLGILPAGTGGDLRKTLGLPGLPEAARRGRLGEAIRHLLGRHHVPCDVGRLDHIAHGGQPATSHFLNIASFGIAGLVDRMVNASSKALGGRVSFFLGSLRATLAYHNKHVRLVVDGTEVFDGPAYNVAVANGRFFGGGMMVAPDALLDDGLFDVVILGDLSFPEVLRLGTRIYAGSHRTLPKVVCLRGRRVEAHADQEVLLDMDGEQPGRLPATLTLLPGALRLKRQDSPRVPGEARRQGAGCPPPSGRTPGRRGGAPRWRGGDP